MKKILLTLILIASIIGIAALGNMVLATSNIQAKLVIENVNNAELNITYPVNRLEKLYVLSTLNTQDTFDANRILISAKADDGTERAISNNVPNQDAYIDVKSNDTYITVSYKLTNISTSTDIGIYSFPLIVKNQDAMNIPIKVTVGKSVNLAFYPGEVISKNGNTQTISISAKKVSAEYAVANLLFTTYSTSGIYIKKDVGRYSIIMPKAKSDRIVKSIKEVISAENSFVKILGIQLPKKINLMVVPVKGLAKAAYEPEAMALPQNLILIDPEIFSYYIAPELYRSVLLHEIAHILVNPVIFSGNSTNAKWVSEGIAVFAQKYISDSYFSISASSTNKPTYQFAQNKSYQKMTREELAQEYQNKFDFEFVVNNKIQSIDKTYEHAGIIFYNLFLRNNASVMQIISDLKSIEPNIQCTKCDTDSALKIIMNRTGLSNENIIYPFKDDLDTKSPILDTLTRKIKTK